MKPSHYLKARLGAPLSKWRDDTSWSFFQFDWLEKIRIHEAQAVMIMPDDPTKSGLPLTVEEVARAHEPDSDLKQCFVPSSIAGSKSHFRKAFLDLCCKVNRDGMPQIFLTLTGNEMGWKDVRARCGDSPGSHPAEVYEQMHRRFQFLMKLIREGKIFGDVDADFVKLEYQVRGCLHYHILIWLRKKTDMCRHVCAVIPPEKFKATGKTAKIRAERERLYFEMRSRVLKYQVHSHNEHCIVPCGSNVVRKKVDSAHGLLLQALAESETLVGPELKLCKDYIEAQSLRVEALRVGYIKAMEKEEGEAHLQEGDASDTLGDLSRDLPPGLKCSKNHPFAESKCCFLDEDNDRWSYFRMRQDTNVVDNTMIIEWNAKILML